MSDTHDCIVVHQYGMFTFLRRRWFHFGGTLLVHYGPVDVQWKMRFSLKASYLSLLLCLTAVIEKMAELMDYRLYHSKAYPSKKSNPPFEHSQGHTFYGTNTSLDFESCCLYFLMVTVRERICFIPHVLHHTCATCSELPSYISTDGSSKEVESPWYLFRTVSPRSLDALYVW